MAQLRSDLLIRLTDRASGPARGILGLMNRLRSVGAGAGGGVMAIGDRATRSVTALHAKLLVATAAAYGLQRAMSGMVGSAATFETKMVDIAQKVDLSESATASLAARLREMSKELGRGPNALASGLDVLLAEGLDPDRAMGILPAIVKGATAFRAEIEDLSKAGMAALNNLNVKVGDFQSAMDALASTGNSGAFELKDMARYLPSLLAQAGGLRMAGVNAAADIGAALQVIRTDAGTSEGAATRLKDVLGKITSDETQKRFAKLGVKDIAGDLRKAQAAAEKAKRPFSAIDFIVEKLDKALKGDAGRVGEIFNDQEAREGSRSLLKRYQELKKIRAEALGAVGLTEKEYARRMKTYEAQMTRFKGAIENVKIALGNQLLPTLTRFASSLSDRINNMGKAVTIFDRMKAAAEGFFSVFGSGGGLDLMDKLGKFIFGDPANLQQDADQLFAIQMKFREFGFTANELAASIKQLATSLEQFRLNLGHIRRL